MVNLVAHQLVHDAQKQFAKGEGAIRYYRPMLTKITGSVTASILLERIRYYASQKSDSEAFYKFNGACEHERYREGDSWQEELGFSRSEFSTARKKIATRIMTGMSLTEHKALFDPDGNLHPVDHIVLYWNDSNNVTWYWLNWQLLYVYTLTTSDNYSGITAEEIAHSLCNAEKLHSIGNVEKPHSIEPQESSITFFTEKTTEKTTENSAPPLTVADYEPSEVELLENAYRQSGQAIHLTIGTKDYERLRAMVDAGITPQRLTDYVAHLKSQSFWQDKNISLKYIVENIGAWNGKPAAFVPVRERSAKEDLDNLNWVN